MNIVKIHQDISNTSAKLEADLGLLDADELVIISREDVVIQFEDVETQNVFEKFDCDIVFAASANFPFDVSGINLYYWKYYPREQGSYHFVHSGMMMGKVTDLTKLVKNIKEAYGEDILEKDIVRHE